MGNVFFLGEKRQFTLEEAREMLPTVRRCTERALQKVKGIREHLTGAPFSTETQAKVQQIVSEWSATVERLGCEPKGMWLVDFDNGNGYYCWRYPEEELEFCHGYEDGFTGRKPIQGSCQSACLSTRLDN